MSISKRNKRGLWVFVFVCVAMSFIPRVLANWDATPISYSSEELQVAEEKVIEQQEKSQKQKKTYVRKKQKFKAPPMAFNPNDYSSADWQNLGLSEKQAAVVLKFSSRGIRSNDDLKKIFVLPEQLFDLIKDSTVYPVIEKKTFDRYEKEVELVYLDLNTASKDELVELPGIGPFYAEKIISYRKELGGYIGTNQLLEIWKFDTERLDQIAEQVHVAGVPQRININNAEIDELKQHPYISYKVANSIVKMRLAHGAYQSLDELLRSDLIDHETFVKIKPYLTL